VGDETYHAVPGSFLSTTPASDSFSKTQLTADGPTSAVRSSGCPQARHFAEGSAPYRRTRDLDNPTTLVSTESRTKIAATATLTQQPSRESGKGGP